MAAKRNWAQMRDKCASEGRCRVCAVPQSIKPLDAAHITARAQARAGRDLGESPHNCVPLCRSCHRAYDAGEFDISPYLSCEERVKSLELYRGDYLAWLRRITGETWVPATSANPAE